MRKVAPWFAVLVLITGLDASAQYRNNRRILQDEGGLTAPSSAAAEQIVRSYVERADRPLALSRQLTANSGAKHLRFEQVANGRPVYGAYVKASVDAHGRITSVIDETVAARDVVASALAPAEALSAALAHRFEGREIPALYRDPIVTPVMYPAADGLHEAFLVETWEKKSNLLWHTVIDAHGAVVHQELRTSTDSYFIFPIQPGLTAQTVVSGPGTGNAESPSGWVTNNTTIGNNVDAYLDRDNNNAADANGRPVSSTKDFLQAFDLGAAPTTSTNQMAAVTNLFYLNNVIHDKLYRHGFNEAAGNFQTNNFGKGGAGNDPVNAEAQDGGGTNNANFSTPTDGSRPRMQMYLWNTTTPNRDGDLDSDIVYHEYGHGLTWRMIGSMSGGLAGAIGEGMGDVLAIYMNGNDKVGEYSTNNTTRGIRRYAYTNYPLTYGDAAGSSVHNDGEIYAATMWRLRELWLNAGYPMDSLWDYMIDGMNYTPANPEYEEMRDGILAASPTQAEDCVIWDAFAQFGIGVGASGTDSCSIFRCTVSVTESFAKPSVCTGGGEEPPPPPPSSITLNATGSKSKGSASVSLAWSGATSTSVDVFRNGAKITTTANDGAHTDSLGKGATGTFTYKVCEAGTTTCSADKSVTF